MCKLASLFVPLFLRKVESSLGDSLSTLAYFLFAFCAWIWFSFEILFYIWLKGLRTCPYKWRTSIHWWFGDLFWWIHYRELLVWILPFFINFQASHWGIKGPQRFFIFELYFGCCFLPTHAIWSLVGIN